MCWQLTLCDPHLSALEVRFSRRCAIQIDVYLTLPYLVVIVLAPKSAAEHDRTLPDRPHDRSREKAQQRSISGQSMTSQRDSRVEHPRDGAGERTRDTHAVPDRQPVKTASAPTSDNRAKSTVASSVSGPLTTSTQPRSSSARSDRPSTDKATDRSLTKVNALNLQISVYCDMCISNSDDDDDEYDNVIFV